jgi:hypothetical protein
MISEPTHISSPFLFKFIKPLLRENLLVMMMGAMCRGDDR